MSRVGWLERPRSLRRGHPGVYAGGMNSVVPSGYRRFVGVVRAILALVVLGSVAYQIADRVAHNVFHPGEYFAYFTIQTSLMDVVVLAVGAWLAFTTPRDTRLFTIVRVCIVGFAVVTCVVYNLLLRNIPAEPGYAWPVWPNEVLHVWAPILLALDWIFAPGRASIRLRAALWVLVYPLAWVSFSLVRGVITGWWPYPFLDPTGPAGWPGVVAYIVGIATFFWLSAFVFVLIARLWERSRARVG
jgi:hypothetical protein